MGLVSVFKLTFVWIILTKRNWFVECIVRPHIIYILADDLGWNDVSYHGSDQIPTPNIDALAYNGVILNRHYALPSCTPSRASLMSGKYPIHTGQHTATVPPQRTGLDLSIKIMPQYFKNIGYSTHLVGKWHLGYYKRQYTPLERGFDSHFGYWTGALSYYDHTNEDFMHNGPNGSNLCGHDLRRNFSSAWDVLGEYATDLFTKEASKVIENHSGERPMFLYLAHLAVHAGNEGRPLEAPVEEITKFMYINNPNRRAYAAMVSKLDYSVGVIVATLARKHMLQNSIIVFASDNGPPNDGVFKNWGSSFPFRGHKQTLWEGGIRVPALIWSPLIKQRSRVFNGLMHITDWLPTLLAAAGEDSSLLSIDGVNQWKAISSSHPSPRTNLVVEIDDTAKKSCLVLGNFKYIKGARGTMSAKSDEYLNEDTIFSRNVPVYNPVSVVSSEIWSILNSVIDNSNLIKNILQLREDSRISCDKSHNQNSVHCEDFPCVFDIINDPCEQINIASELPVLTQHFQNIMEQLILNKFPEDPYIIDQEANPEFYNGTWSIWQ